MNDDYVPKYRHCKNVFQKLRLPYDMVTNDFNQDLNPRVRICPLVDNKRLIPSKATNI